MLRFLVCRNSYKFFNFFNDYLQNRQLHYISYFYKVNCNSLRRFSSKIKENGCNQLKPCIDKPMKWPSEKRSNFSFHDDTESAMNEQINVELKAFYYYLSMAAYFGRVDVALPGCESFFIQMYHEELDHALKFLNYVKMRGGKVQLCSVSPPDDQDWKCPLHAFNTALKLEMDVSEKLVAVNATAEKHGDINASDFIITGFMQDQMKSINEIGRLVTVLSGIGDHALARFLFDKNLLENYVKCANNILKNKSQRKKF